MVRVLLLMFIVLAAPLEAGCPACYEAVQYLVVDFEGCTGTCDFAVTGEGDAYVATTVHPGEHGLFVDGETRATRTIGATVDTWAGIEPRLDFVTSCADGAYIEVTLRNPNDYALTITLGPGRAQVWSGDYQQVSIPLPRYADDDGVYEINELRVVGASGMCVLDQITLHTPGGC